jgi:DNA-binding response OmpR family regulator
MEMPDSVPASSPPRRLLLLSADWQTRTLTLVSLQDLGYAVLALPSLHLGVKAILAERVDPPLVLLDTKDDARATPDQVQALRDLVPDALMILIAEAWYRDQYAALAAQMQAFLVRPILMHDLVATVQRLLPPTATGE